LLPLSTLNVAVSPIIAIELSYDIPVKFVPQSAFSEDEEPFIAIPVLESSSRYSLEFAVKRRVEFEYTSGSEEEVLIVKRSRKAKQMLCETYWKTKSQTVPKPEKRQKVSEAPTPNTMEDDDDRGGVWLSPSCPLGPMKLHLESLFAKFGVIESVDLQLTSATLKFINPISAGAALALNGTKFHSNSITVKLKSLDCPKFTVLLSNISPQTHPTALVQAFPQVKSVKNVQIVTLTRHQSQAYLTFIDSESAKSAASRGVVWSMDGSAQYGASCYLR
jgi:hypothetical protein